jgi:sensor c-di-GMP phosphodiesterase-like protein
MKRNFVRAWIHVGVSIITLGFAITGCEEEQRQRIRDTTTQAAEDAEPYVEQAKSAATQAAEMARPYADKARSAATQAVERAKPYVEQATAAATQAVERVRVTATQAAEDIQKKVSDPE